DQAWDAGQSLDEDDPRVDGADLFSQLRLALRGNLSAEDDQVELFDIEAAGDVGEVVGALSAVTKFAEAGDRFVEDELALAEQQHVAVGVVGSHVGSLTSRRANAATASAAGETSFGSS